MTTCGCHPLLNQDARWTRLPREMSRKFHIRPSTAADASALEDLYRAAFPDEDLLPLLRDLLSLDTAFLSLVGLAGTSVAGHVAFTRCSVEGSSQPAALLAPLAVSPPDQGQGLGAALVREGLGRLSNEGILCVFVLGNPAYYARFGFAPEEQVKPPYPLVPEWQTAWQSLRLGATHSNCAGRLCLPPAWMRPSLWAP